MVFSIGRQCAVLSIGMTDCGIFNRTTLCRTVHRAERLWYFLIGRQCAVLSIDRDDRLSYFQ